MKKQLLSLLASPLLFTACSQDSPEERLPDNSNLAEQFIIAATVQGSNATSNVLLSSSNIDSGSISAEGKGLLNDGASHWVFNSDKYLFALTYNQGNAGTTKSFMLNSAGDLQQRDMEYKVARFTSFGNYNKEIITTSTGDSPASLADANGYLPKTLLINYLDTEAETSTQNSTADGSYSMENYLGNGEFVTLAGIEQRGDKIISGAIPMGLSQYGAAQDGGKWIRSGFQDLVKTADGGTNSSSYKKGELQWTQYPDECWVAIFPDKTLKNPKLIRTDRISYPAGRFKSAYYQTIWNSAKGDTYVFSPSFAKTMTDSRQQTKLPAGVVRIPAGSEDFDTYYCDIEAISGGKSFLRVAPAGGEYFLLTMYDRPLTQTGYQATELAIFNAERKTLTYVKNLPSDITSIANNTLVKDGKVYVAIHTASGYPAIWSIDPASASASKGVTVEATTISGFGFLKR